MGIEFAYAAETAFVSPILLKIGVEHQHMTLVWALSPLVGFFLTPVLGSISDKCRLPLGRRRPFIILLSIGVFLGLLLVPNGELLGYAFGDADPYDGQWSNGENGNATTISVGRRMTTARLVNTNDTMTTEELQLMQQPAGHPWGIFFTVLGTVLLDFDADACQSPARAYLLDVTVSEDHAMGLSTFTIMAGLGGFMGYSLGGINWNDTFIGELLGGHVRAVFTLVTILFIVCVSATITSFREMPLWKLEAQTAARESSSQSHADAIGDYVDMDSTSAAPIDVGDDAAEPDETRALAPTNQAQPAAKQVYGATADATKQPTQPPQPESVSLAIYLLSILHMPHSIRMVCLTNLFCWMAHVCYSLYFTDFVGESVFGGDPAAAPGSAAQLRYEEGVRFGCWGMAMYSLSCACYSLVIERLITKFR